MEYDNSETFVYISATPREYRNQMGQFFTPVSIKNRCVELVKKYVTPTKILEPSYGTGEFLRTISSAWPDAKVTGIELDPTLGKVVHPGVKTYKADFLTSKINAGYDLVIVNPPYFELPAASKYKAMYSAIVQGRFNIYALFVYKAITLLNEKGVLCFVIPESIKSSPSFDKLRKFIVEKCEVLELFSLGNFSSEVAQGCIIFMCQKKAGGSTGRLVNLSTMIFTENQYRTEKTIADMGVTVKTGSIVWNAHKEKLHDIPVQNGAVLIYSDFITANGEVVVPPLSAKRNSEKKVYISLPGNREPCILVSRSSGKNIKCALYLEPPFDYLAENHINVITGPVDVLKDVYKSLMSSETKTYLIETMGTVNLSKTQLLKLPYFGVQQEVEIVLE